MSEFSELASDPRRYERLIASITDYAIFMLDAQGRVASWNAGAERIKGYTAEEILGEHFGRFYPPEDQAAGAPARALQTAGREGRFETESWRVRKDGQRFWAHVIMDPIRDTAGKLIGFAKITRDLSERRVAEEQLRKSQEQFRLLVQGVTDYAIYLLDPNGHIVSWNAGAERIKGYAAEEIIGQHFSKFYIEDEVEAGVPQHALATALREGKYERESIRRRKDGSRFWAHVVIDPIHDSNGTHIGFAKITRDVTKRKQAEQELSETRNRLAQSQKLESIGQLTGGIAHDFNNLLTAVLGSLEILKKRLPNDPRLLRPLENAVAGARRGASLTQRLLAFARKQELDLKPVDVVETVHGMSELLRSSTGSAIDVEMRFPLRLNPARTDPNQLELAILNLVLNARDAMPAGGRILISGSNRSLTSGNSLELSAGEYVCLSIEDSGSGMDDETLAKAIEPFFTTKGVGRGTGLGLPMVHGMAAQSGGRLNIRSETGKGTVAEIWLPVGRASAKSEVGAVQHRMPDTDAAPLTVLIVDDDPLVLHNTSVALDDLGHTAIEAASGQAALAILGQRRDIDVVVTDQVMPGMTGLQLAESIRAERPDLPIVLASGYAELPAQAMHLPRLQKPFTQAELVRAIRFATNPEGGITERASATS